MKSTAEGKYQVDFMDRDGQPFLQKKILIQKNIFRSTRIPNFLNFSAKKAIHSLLSYFLRHENFDFRLD